MLIATIRVAEYDRFQPTDKFQPAGMDVISLFERVFVGRDLTQREQQRLNDAVSEPDARARIRQIGLKANTSAPPCISARPSSSAPPAPEAWATPWSWQPPTGAAAG